MALPKCELQNSGDAPQGLGAFECSVAASRRVGPLHPFLKGTDRLTQLSMSSSAEKEAEALKDKMGQTAQPHCQSEDTSLVRKLAGDITKDLGK